MSQSTAGYASEADALLKTYEQIAVEDVHRPVLPLLPTTPARFLDIGAGTGRDAAYFASLGHQVTAVEPVDALREGARKLHASSRIEWIGDGLPDLASLRGRSFDVVLLTAVWMHLDAAERAAAMPSVASLVAPDGLLILSLRHGPVPVGRRMFDVPAIETIALAGRERLHCLVNTVTGSVQADKKDVTWTRLAFHKG